MKGGLSDLMKQAQSLQENMQKAQADAAEREVEGQSGAGMIRVVMNGRYDVRRVNIDEMVMDEPREILEDLLAAAVNDAVKKVEASNAEAMSGLAAGLNLPPGFKMPFQ